MEIREMFRVVGIIFMVFGTAMWGRHFADKKDKEYDVAFIVIGTACSVLPLVF